MRLLYDLAFEDNMAHLLRHPHRESLHECLRHILASIEYGQQRVRLMVRFRDAVEHLLLNVTDAPGQRCSESSCNVRHNVPVRLPTSIGELDLAMALTSLSDVGSALTTQ